MEPTLFAAICAHRKVAKGGDCIDRDEVKRQLLAALEHLSVDHLLVQVDEEPDPALQQLRYALAVTCAKLQEVSTKILWRNLHPAAAAPLYAPNEPFEQMERLVGQIDKLLSEIVKWEAHLAQMRPFAGR